MTIGTIDEKLILIIAATVAALLIIFLISWIWRIEKRLKNLLKGESINIENAILKNHKKLEGLEEFQKRTENNLNVIQGKLKKSIRSIKTVRFNPFRGTGGGGNQSFSSAFIDEEGSGVVLTGLYHRERISLFAKPIKNASSEFELSEEEKKALNEARLDIKEN